MIVSYLNKPCLVLSKYKLIYNGYTNEKNRDLFEVIHENEHIFVRGNISESYNCFITGWSKEDLKLSVFGRFWELIK